MRSSGPRFEGHSTTAHTARFAIMGVARGVDLSGGKSIDDLLTTEGRARVGRESPRSSRVPGVRHLAALVFHCRMHWNAVIVKTATIKREFSHVQDSQYLASV